MTEHTNRQATIPAGEVQLAGSLTIPGEPSGVVVFVHGSGSSRHSPRNQAVADALNKHGQATLLFDLLTAQEERNRANVFDIGLLADRLVEVTKWLRMQPEVTGLPIGYFGASTGAAAALVAAAHAGTEISAVVSRGGRPDLAGAFLPKVRAGTLLIVGGNDPLVLDLNRVAKAHLECPSELVVVPGATHLFEETGALAAVSRLASEWFEREFKDTQQWPLTD